MEGGYGVAFWGGVKVWLRFDCISSKPLPPGGGKIGLKYQPKSKMVHSQKKI